jgi:hypothetical protein
MLEIVLSVLGALGGGALIIGGFAHWLGNLWAKRLIQEEKAKLDLDIESHKVKLRKSEFLFEKEYEAVSQFVALLRGILPRHSYPEMDWYEACDYIAHDFETVEHKINDYLAIHGAVLSDEVVDLLITALGISGETKFEITGPEVPDSANKAANTLYEKLHEAEQKLLEKLNGQIIT